MFGPTATSLRPQALGASLVVAMAAVVGLLVASPGGLRIATALTVALALILIAFRLPQAVWYLLVVWSVSLGLVRRLISSVSPKEPSGDPLLLVGGAVWVALLALAVERGAFANRTRLTTAVLVLWSLLLVSAVNPLQGGLAVGLAGSLVVVVPMSAFFVGRALVDDRLLSRLLWLVACLGLVVAGYGTVQAFRGFPSWDAAWIRDEGYAALNVRGTIRPFASFSAGSEYAVFLGIGVVAWFAQARGVLRWPIVAAALALLSTALWYEASRGIIVMTVAAIWLVLAARVGLRLWRSLLLGAVIIAALPFVLGVLAPSQFSSAPTDRLAQHQVEGLSDPFGETSTLPLHIEMVQRGLASSLREPLGVGVGATTIAANKFGGTHQNTEADLGNVPVATGMPGLLAYGAVVALGMPRAYRLAATRRDAVSLAALGILAVTFLQWLTGGHYAVMFWPWLVLGWVDAATSQRPASVPAKQRAGAAG
jgi:hypothetical protein